MTKLEFMKELESLLLDIPLEEREEALKYYHGYFEDAGEDQEQEIIAELGSPKKVADIIKTDLVSNAADHGNKGYFTENGYQETMNSNDQVAVIDVKEKEAGQNTETFGQDYGKKPNQNPFRAAGQGTYQGSGTYSQPKQTRNNDNILLIILLCIFAIPVGLPLICSAFGIAIGLIAALFGMIVGFGAAGIAMIFGGIALFISGLIQLGEPLIGFAMVGCGLIVSGLGMLFTLFSGVLCTKVVPALVRGIVSLCRLPFKNRSVMA